MISAAGGADSVTTPCSTARKKPPSSQMRPAVAEPANTVSPQTARNRGHVASIPQQEQVQTSEFATHLSGHDDFPAERVACDTDEIRRWTRIGRDQGLQEIAPLILVRSGKCDGQVGVWRAERHSSHSVQQPSPAVGAPSVPPHLTAYRSEIWSDRTTNLKAHLVGTGRQKTAQMNAFCAGFLL